MIIILVYMLRCIIQFTVPFLIFWIIVSITESDKIKSILFGIHYPITRDVRNLIRNQRKKMKNEIKKVRFKEEKKIIEDNYFINTVNKLKKLYKQDKYSALEMGSRFNILNSDPEFLMCIFTGIVGGLLYDIISKYLIAVGNTNNNFKIKNLILKNMSIGIFDSITGLAFLLLFTFLVYYFRWALVIHSNRDAVYDETEKIIIKKAIEEKYKIKI